MKKHFFTYQIITVLFVIVINIVHCYSQVDVTTKFLYKYHPSDYKSIPYRLFVPDNYDTQKSYPIILTLHGLGECGTDNEIHIELNHIATCWADSAFQQKHPCFVVSPQCPVSFNWTTESVKFSVSEIMDSLISNYNIDTNRIYITGLSLGGNGTWDYLISNPDLYAAAIPVCGWHDSSLVKSIKHIPIWNHHGASDPTVNVTNARQMISAYENLNLPVVYTNCNEFICNTMSAEKKYRLISDEVDYIYSEYNGVGHNAWDYAYTDTSVLEWLLSKRRRIENIIKLTEPKEYKTISNNYFLKFESQVDSGIVNIMFSNDLGYTWEPVTEDTLKADSTEVNTELLPDSPFGIFKVQLKDSLADTYGTDYSYYYRINNSANGIPFLRYKTMYRLYSVTADSISIHFLTGDAEEDPLNLIIYYKSDDTCSYSAIDTFIMESSLSYQEKYIKMDDLQYGKKARLKFKLTDNINSVFDSTKYFTNKHNEPSMLTCYKFDDGIQVFPNPAKGEININVKNLPLSEDSYIGVTIYNLAGNMIFHNEIHSHNKDIITIELIDEVKSGIYILRLELNNSVINRKVIIN
jgi:predicted esterase